MASKSRPSRPRKPAVIRSSPTAPTVTERRLARGGGPRSAVVPQARGAAARPATARPVSARADGAEPEPDDTADGARYPAPTWLQWTTFVIALLGLAASAYLTYTHFSEAKLLGCSESGAVNCLKVTTSAQSHVFGIPVAVLGLAFYVFVVPIMSPWAWRMTRREVPLLRLAAMVTGIGFVIYLLYAELYMIGSICLYCTSVHVITFLLFVLTVFAAAARGLRPAAPAPAPEPPP